MNNRFTRHFLNEVKNYYSNSRNYLNEEDYSISDIHTTGDQFSNIDKLVTDYLKDGNYQKSGQCITIPFGQKSEINIFPMEMEAYDENNREVTLSPKTYAAVRKLAGNGLNNRYISEAIISRIVKKVINESFEDEMPEDNYTVEMIEDMYSQTHEQNQDIVDEIGNCDSDIYDGDDKFFITIDLGENIVVIVTFYYYVDNTWDEPATYDSPRDAGLESHTELSEVEIYVNDQKIQIDDENKANDLGEQILDDYSEEIDDKLGWDYYNKDTDYDSDLL